MNQNHRTFFVLPVLFALLFLGLSQEVTGQSELLVRGQAAGISARALAMGGAYTSVAEDYSATYWNPAGLAMMRRMEFFISVPSTYYQTKASFSGNSLDRNESFTKMNSIGFAFPVPTYRGSLVFAFGYNRVRNFDRAFEFTWFNPYENLYALNDLMQETWDTLEKGHFGQYTFSGAMDISPNISLGASINLWRGNNLYEDSYLATDPEDIWNIQEFGLDNTIESELRAVNMKFGGLYRLGQLIRLGGTVEFPYTVKIDENSNYHYWEYWEDGTSPYEEKNDYKFEYRIRNPFKFSAGGSLFLPLITLSADINYTDWSQMEYQTDPPFTKAEPLEIDGEWVYLDSTKSEINRDIRKIYQSTMSVHLGGELSLPFLGTQLRAGLFVEPSPLKESETENYRKYITAGAGFLLDKQMKVDVTWIHGWWKNDITGFSNYIPLMQEDIKLDQIEVSLAIRF